MHDRVPSGHLLPFLPGGTRMTKLHNSRSPLLDTGALARPKTANSIPEASSYGTGATQRTAQSDGTEQKKASASAGSLHVPSLTQPRKPWKRLPK